MRQTATCNYLIVNLVSLFNFQHMQMYLVISYLQYSDMRISLFF